MPDWVTFMKRLGLTLCLVLPGCSRDETRETPETCRSSLQRHAGLSLPMEARNVECQVEALMVQWVFAKFDVPSAALRVLSTQEPMNRLPSFAERPEVWELMAIRATEVPWWRTHSGTRVRCSEAEWGKTGGTSDLMCRLSVCVAAIDDSWSTVYLQYSEEPVTPGWKPPPREGGEHDNKSDDNDTDCMGD